MRQSSHLLEQIAGGIGFVMVSITLALAGCEEPAVVPEPSDRAVDIDVDAPGVDIEIDKPGDVE
jgi:hypothetical protein